MCFWQLLLLFNTDMGEENKTLMIILCLHRWYKAYVKWERPGYVCLHSFTFRRKYVAHTIYKYMRQGKNFISFTSLNRHYLVSEINLTFFFYRVACLSFVYLLIDFEMNCGKDSLLHSGITYFSWVLNFRRISEWRQKNDEIRS